MNPIVRVEKHKRPSGVGSWRAYHLGVDDHGVWLFTPAHSMFRSDTTEGVGSCEVAQDRLNGVGRNSVTLMPRGQWRVATCVQDAVNLCSADISTAIFQPWRVALRRPRTRPVLEGGRLRRRG